MLFDELTTLYKHLRLHNYRNLFGKIQDKAGSLSATEAFSVDVIYILGEPTVKQFSDFLGISQPNASYKVGSLINKGYIEKEASEDDRREQHLRVSEKFHDYYGENMAVLKQAVQRLEKTRSPKDIEVFKDMLGELNKML